MHCEFGFDVYVMSVFAVNAAIFLVTLHLTSGSLTKLSSVALYVLAAVRVPLPLCITPDSLALF